MLIADREDTETFKFVHHITLESTASSSCLSVDLPSLTKVTLPRVAFGRVETKRVYSALLVLSSHVEAGALKKYTRCLCCRKCGCVLF